ncbi:MAG: S-layer homology domain-containing protein [bacterium]|nr:S-layer homology domain-containing protein [bacterium]
MKRFFLVLVGVLLCIHTAEARPSFRSIRESATTADEDGPTAADWRHKYAEPDGWGLRFTYPKSWNDPLKERGGVSEDASIDYAYIRLLPHDAGLGKRDNYIFELYALVWDIGHELSSEEVQRFANDETRPRFREYERLEERFTHVADVPAWTIRFTTMTGYREETWFSNGRYLYTLGFRSLDDFIEENHFFYEDMLSSVTLQDVGGNEEQIIPDGSVSALFSDVSPEHPYADAIVWAKNTGTVGGYPDGNFLPEQTVNRVEFLKIILEALGVEVSSAKSNFPDLDQGAWYIPYIATAKALGIVEGYPDGTFQPSKEVNVAEALKMAYEANAIETRDTGGQWFDRYVSHAIDNHVLFTYLDPSAPMKRKDVVWLVWRLYEYGEEIR